MTEENLTFILETYEKLGFGVVFHEDTKKAMQSGVYEWNGSASMVWDKATGESIKIEPRVQERKEGEGFYVLKGYQATRTLPDSEPTTQFFNVYKKGGFDLEEARELLRGGAVFNRVWDDDQKKMRERYTSLNFNRTKKDGNFGLTNSYDVKPYEYDVIKILGKMQVVGTQDQKDEYLRKLNKGHRIEVNVRKEGGFERVLIEADPHNRAVNQITPEGKKIPFRLAPVKEMTLVKDGPKQKESQQQVDPNLQQANEILQQPQRQRSGPRRKAS